MSTFLADVRETLAPRDDARHGPLSPLLIAMTAVTGLVDAYSFLALGHVFVANMTGNVLFLGFALAGAPGFSISATLLALGAFIIGGFIGGALAARHGAHRGRLLTIAAATQTLLMLGAVLLALTAGIPIPIVHGHALAALLGAAMGLQNATVRKLAVPDLPTTVLTLTLIGVPADSQLVGGSGSHAGRRLVAVAAMLLGALIGALLLVHGAAVLPLVIAAILIGGVAIATYALARANPPWVYDSPPDEAKEEDQTSAATNIRKGGTA
ncbi:MAG TPA: YoaK family protein [Ktedonobacterales bacterium]|jgi:uncharacterized membrane protein YoaK (UPF0700 family)